MHILRSDFEFQILFLVVDLLFRFLYIDFWHILFLFDYDWLLLGNLLIFRLLDRSRSACVRSGLILINIVLFWRKLLLRLAVVTALSGELHRALHIAVDRTGGALLVTDWSLIVLIELALSGLALVVLVALILVLHRLTKLALLPCDLILLVLGAGGAVNWRVLLPKLVHVRVLRLRKLRRRVLLLVSHILPGLLIRVVH